MYISVQTAAGKFGLSVRRVQLLCEQGRIPGAVLSGGAWHIPADAPKPPDGRKKGFPDAPEGQYTVEDMCKALSISKATAKNWIRLGKLTPDRENRCFSREYAQAVISRIHSNESTALKSRRNKKASSGQALYRDYIHTAENQLLVEDLLVMHLIQEERDLLVLLAGFAVQLYCQSSGIPDIDLPNFLSRHTQCGFYTLVMDLLDSLPPDPQSLDRLLPALSKKLRFVPGEDTLGFVYISLRDLGLRKTAGIYYTPAALTHALIGDLRECDPCLSEKTVCDPCCGSGNFLLSLASAGMDCAQLYGQDLDPVSVKLARINLALTAPNLSVEELRSHIRIGNTLFDTFSQKFDVLLGNPPWGFDFSPEDTEKCRALFRTAAGRNPESYDLFVEKGLSMLSPGGILAFILPEAILTVAAHEPVRKILTENCSFRFLSYLGNVFSGVQCPSVILGVRLDHAGSALGCRVRTGKDCFVITRERELSGGSLALNLSDEDYACLGAISSLENAVFLKDNARFALGIVTGNNKQLILSEPREGYEPILRGSDVFRFGIRPSGHYIRYAPETFQQSAPTELYRAKEKLLYRFICEVPVFAYDDAQTLSLNSCNILIPEIPGLAVKYILAVLNSSVAAYFLSKKFCSVKLLRSHIEQLPIPMAPPDIQQRIIEKADRMMASCENLCGLYEELDGQIMDLYLLSPNQRRTIHSTLAGTKLFLNEQ